MNIVTKKNGENYYTLPFYPYVNGKIILLINKGDDVIWKNKCIENDLVVEFNKINYETKAKTISEINDLYVDYCNKKEYPVLTNVMLSGVEKAKRWNGEGISDCGKFYKITRLYERPDHFSLAWMERPKPIILNTDGKSSITLSGNDGTSITLSCEGKVTPIYNLVPGVEYTISLDGTTLSDKLIPEGRIRMINFPGIRNMRDLGGLPTYDNKEIKYRRVYRGSTPTWNYQSSSSFTWFTRKYACNTLELYPTNTATELKNYVDKWIPFLGINAHVELKTASTAIANGTLDVGSNNSEKAITKIHSSVTYDNNSGNGAAGGAYTGLFGSVKKYATNLSNTTKDGQLPDANHWNRNVIAVLTLILNDKVVYFNCRDGHDRTATTALLIEGLCGVKTNYILKDYELSSFALTSKYIDSGLYNEDDETPINMLAELMTYYQIPSLQSAKTSSDGIRLCDCILNWFSYWYDNIPNLATPLTKITGYSTAASVITALLNKLLKSDGAVAPTTGTIEYTSGLKYSASTDLVRADSSGYYSKSIQGYVCPSNGDATVTVNNTTCRCYIVVLKNEDDINTWDNDLTGKKILETFSTVKEFYNSSDCINPYTFLGLSAGDKLVLITNSGTPNIQVSFVANGADDTADNSRSIEYAYVTANDLTASSMIIEGTATTGYTITPSYFNPNVEITNVLSNLGVDLTKSADGTYWYTSYYKVLTNGTIMGGYHSSLVTKIYWKNKVTQETGMIEGFIPCVMSRTYANHIDIKLEDLYRYGSRNSGSQGLIVDPLYHPFVIPDSIYNGSSKNSSIYIEGFGNTGTLLCNQIYYTTATLSDCENLAKMAYADPNDSTTAVSSGSHQSTTTKRCSFEKKAFANGKAGALILYAGILNNLYLFKDNAKSYDGTARDITKNVKYAVTKLDANAANDNIISDSYENTYNLKMDTVIARIYY